MPPRQVSFKAMIHPHIKGKITLHSLQTQTLDISTDHNHIANPTMTGAAAVTEGTHHTPQSSHHSGSCYPLADDNLITTYAETHTTGIVTTHLKHTTSPTDVTHATTPWTIASLTLATLTTLHEDHNWQRRSSHTQGLCPPIKPTDPRLLSSRTPHQILPQIQTMTLIL